MPRQADTRPLVIKRYGSIDLARGMSVVGGIDGDILVIARFRDQSRRRTFPQDTPLMDRLHWQHSQIEQMRILTTRRVTDPTFSQDIDVYLASVGEVRRERASQWLDYWRAWYGYKRRADLTLQDCQAFFEHIRPKTNSQGEFSASSKNKLRTYCLAVWRYHDGKRHACPLLDVPVLEEPKGRSRELSPDATLRLLAAMPDGPHRAKLGLLFFTGCRPFELTTLRPDAFHIDGDHPYVAFVTAKGGPDRIVTIPDQALPYVAAFIRHQAWKTRGSLFAAMTRTAAKIGLVLTTGERHPGGRRKFAISPYSLRHAYAMNLRRSGAGIEDIADALGHSDLRTTRRYAQAIPERQAALTNAMWDKAGLYKPA
jgi:integrase